MSKEICRNFLHRVFFLLTTNHLPLQPFSQMLTDINECLEDPSICGSFQCENSYGTYSCAPPPTTTTTEEPMPPSSTTTTIGTATTETEIEIEKERVPEIEDKNEIDDDDGSDEEEDNKSEAEESEINKVPEAPANGKESEAEDDEMESEKVQQQHRHEDSRENSIETREDIDNEIPAATTSTQRYVESESGEDSGNEDDGGRHSDDETEHTRMHHQSSTVKSDLENECDDGWRLDDSGNCVGKWKLYIDEDKAH